MDFHGGIRLCLGKYFSNALCNVNRFNSAKENGSLHGDFQLFIVIPQIINGLFGGPIVTEILEIKQWIMSL